MHFSTPQTLPFPSQTCSPGSSKGKLQSSGTGTGTGTKETPSERPALVSDSAEEPLPSISGLGGCLKRTAPACPPALPLPGASSLLPARAFVYMQVAVDGFSHPRAMHEWGTRGG